jgi:cytochrome b
MTDPRRAWPRVWDPLVRVFHWCLAGLIAVAWLSADGAKWLHVPVGYGIAALVAFRILWGFIGSRHARFSDFVRGPGTVLRYLRDLILGRERRMLGHNPAGGAMIVTLLLTVSATALTGWLQTTDAFFGSDFMETSHKMLATLILFLVAGHVSGVVFESFRHRENLVSSMVTGRKRPLGPEDTV